MSDRSIPLSDALSAFLCESLGVSEQTDGHKYVVDVLDSLQVMELVVHLEEAGALCDLDLASGMTLGDLDTLWRESMSRSDGQMSSSVPPDE